MQQRARCIAYFRKLFGQKDVIALEDLSTQFANPGVLKKLQALGFSVSEISSLLEKMAAGSAKTTTCDELMKAFFAIRNEGLAGMRGINFLRQEFNEADTEGIGELDKAQIKRTFCTDK